MVEMNMYEKMYQDSIGKRITKAKAIRLKCLDCCVYQVNEVKNCPTVNCPLWRYRMGHEEKDELYYQHHNDDKALSVLDENKKNISRGINIPI